MCRELFSEIRNRPSVLLRHCNLIFMLFGSLLYVVSPVDFIPEAVFGLLGTVDDAGIIFACFYGVSQIFYRVFMARNERV
jgi:RING finger protein 170